MLKRYTRKPDEVDGNVFWTTMSDMFLGLMMVFMTLFVFAMTGYSQLRVQAQKIQSEVAQELSQELKKQNIDADVDLMTGHVKIADLNLFAVGSYELTPSGKAYLDKLIPTYFRVMFSKPAFANRILNVLVQGHSDSQTFRGVNTQEEQFIKNLDLSTKRAIAVESYIFKTKYDKKYTNKLMKILVAEGKSNSEPIIVNGKENYAKSRRVELRLMLRDPEIQDFLIKELGVK